MMGSRRARAFHGLGRGVFLGRIVARARGHGARDSRAAEGRRAGKVDARRSTHPEGAEVRLRVVGSLLAEGTAEHVARAMAETARAGALVTHPYSTLLPSCVP